MQRIFGNDRRRRQQIAPAAQPLSDPAPLTVDTIRHPAGPRSGADGRPLASEVCPLRVGGNPERMDRPQSNPEKDPSDWTTGDEPMTGPQASYLETLCREAGVEFDPDLSKADASRRIDELQQKTGRGAES